MAGPEGEDKKANIVYGVDERPPLGRSVIYGFQHIFAMILGSIMGGVVIGTAVGLDDLQIGNLISYINIAMGIATILQVKWGVRLPLIQGSTMGHVPAYVALGSIGVSLFANPIITMQYLTGALLVGALLEAGIGFLNIMRYLRRVFSPITVGVIIMMVGLGLWPVVNDFIGDAWGVAFVIFILVIFFSFAFGTTIRTMALFLAVIVGYAFAVIGTAMGWFPTTHSLYVNFETISQASWIVIPQPFPWGFMKFDVGLIFAMTIPYFATALESLGDYIAVSESSNVETPSPKRLSRGIMMEGISSAISATMGGTASSSFSQNVGIVRLTGVASRFVCIVAGVILIALGLLGKLGAVLGAIPRPILGAVYLVAFGILVLTGLRVAMKAKILTSRNEIIIGTSLLLGLALPAYFSNNPIEIPGIIAAQVFLNVFLATPMIVAGIWALVLDNLLPGSDEERGLKGWLGSEVNGVKSGKKRQGESIQSRTGRQKQAD